MKATRKTRNSKPVINKRHVPVEIKEQVAQFRTSLSEVTDLNEIKKIAKKFGIKPNRFDHLPNSGVQSMNLKNTICGAVSRALRSGKLTIKQATSQLS